MVTHPIADGFSLLYQDDYLLVANKPSGLLSVPGNTPEKQDCLEKRLTDAFGSALVVHRLDQATSGIIVFARTAPVQAFLHAEFRQRRPKKTYEAVVWGQMAKEAGRVDLPLIADWPNRPKQMVDFERGKPAVTDYQVLERGADRTRVALFPITGRSHQLRVHMLSLGHPILGDTLYAQDEALAAAPRLLLHAKSLEIFHPIMGETLRFDCPADF